MMHIEREKNKQWVRLRPFRREGSECRRQKKPADRVPFLGPAKLLRAWRADSEMIVGWLLDNFFLQTHAGNF
jgi:hypothetical protein